MDMSNRRSRTAKMSRTSLSAKLAYSQSFAVDTRVCTYCFPMHILDPAEKGYQFLSEAFPPGPGIHRSGMNFSG